MEGNESILLGTIIPYMVNGRKSYTTYWITTNVSTWACVLLPLYYQICGPVSPVQSCSMLHMKQCQKYGFLRSKENAICNNFNMLGVLILAFPVIHLQIHAIIDGKLYIQWLMLWPLVYTGRYYASGVYGRWNATVADVMVTKLCWEVLCVIN